MADKYILDTHALVWYLEGNSRLGRKAKTTMAAVESEMVLPLIALAEAAYLIEKGRIGIPRASISGSLIPKRSTSVRDKYSDS